MFRKPITDCGSCIIGRACGANRCPWSPVSRPAGARLVREGEMTARMLFVRDGLIALESADGEGNAAVRGPRTLLGAESLRGHAARASAAALTPVKLCVLAPEQAQAWLGPERGPARAVLELVLDEAEHLGDESAWRRGDCLARVARFLLAQSESNASPPRALSKATIARILGMRAETYSRCLRQLCDRALVEPRPPHPVRDVEALSRIAGTA